MKRTIKLSVLDYEVVLLSLGERYKFLRDRVAEMEDCGIGGDYSTLILKQAAWTLNALEAVQRQDKEDEK